LNIYAVLAGRIIASWNETPIKWYPLPIAVGALLLVAIQYRKKVRQAQKEVHVDEHGIEVVKLKGPWHVRRLFLFLTTHFSFNIIRYTF
jgi:phosphatidylserine decarboxylase